MFSIDFGKPFDNALSDDELDMAAYIEHIDPNNEPPQHPNCKTYMGIDMGAGSDTIAMHAYLFVDGEHDVPVHHPSCGCTIKILSRWQRLKNWFKRRLKHGLR